MAAVTPPNAANFTSAIPHAIASSTTGAETALLTTIVTATATNPNTTLSTAVPKTIPPPGGYGSPSLNSVLVQIGFTDRLNYNFVAENSNATAQIFEFVPPGIGYAIGVGDVKVVMQRLQPLDTSARLAYITTLALVFIPRDKVVDFSAALSNSSSALYNNPNVLVASLMSLIDPTVPLLPIDVSTGDGGVASPTTSFSSSISTLIMPPAPASTSEAPQVSPTGQRSNATLPSWGIALIVIGAVMFLLMLGTLFYIYRIKKATHRPTDKSPVDLPPSASILSTNLSSASPNQDDDHEKLEPVTPATYYELDDTKSMSLQHELGNGRLANYRSELGYVNAHTERSELAPRV